MEIIVNNVNEGDQQIGDLLIDIEGITNCGLSLVGSIPNIFQPPKYLVAFWTIETRWEYPNDIEEYKSI